MSAYPQKFKFDVDKVVEKLTQPAANSANLANCSMAISNFSKISSESLEKSKFETRGKQTKPSLEQILELSSELEAFEERAAIIEFDGTHARSTAEKLAYDALMIRLERNSCFSWLIFNTHHNKTQH